MTKFHEGQEVEVWTAVGVERGWREWRKAKIVERGSKTWIVEFTDGTRAVSNTDRIRATLPIDEAGYDPEGINRAIRRQLSAR